MRRILSTCVILVFVASSVIAQKKPWTEWSKKDAEKLLNDSAWGQTQTEGGSAPSDTTVITSTASSGNAGRDLQRKGESGEPKASKAINYRVRFLTAKPIREAFARMVTLVNSDKGLPEQLQAFIDRDFSDYIVVVVNCDSEDQRAAGGIQQAFSRLTMEMLKDKVYLERKDGKKLPLMDYKIPSGDGMGAKFIFSRTLEGQSFLTPESANVRFFMEFNDKLKINMRFKVSDMMYDGKLEY